MAQLKEKLRELNLPIAGNKAELLKRLYEADPTGGWMAEDAEDDEDAEASGPLDTTVRENPNETKVEAITIYEQRIDMYRREKELAEREAQLMRREIELLKGAQQPRATSQVQTVRREDAACDVAKASISAIADLLGHFDGGTGDYENWELQLKLLKKTYRLSDDYVRILIGMRLRGKASEWFKSKPEHLELSVDELLDELREMYNHRPSRVKLRKRFEERVWKLNETFHQYVHEKVILANRVPIPEDELVEYLIDGIPEASLRDQARIGRIATKASLLRAFEKVTLKDKGPAGKSGNAEQRQGNKGQRQQPNEKTKDEKKEAASGTTEKRCFNCGQREHTAANCPTKTEGPKCFQCGERGHIAAKCAKKLSAVQSVDASVNKTRVKYTKSVSIDGCALTALIDTGSDICLMCASAYIRLGCPRLERKELRFCGVGTSNNLTMGEFNTELTIDDHTYPILIRVVPDTLINYELLVGIDFLNLVELTVKPGEVVVNPLQEQVHLDENLPEILQINLDSNNDDVDVSHVSGPEHREKIKELVREYKPIKTREIDFKMSIILRDDEPVYQRARRLAAPERELVNVQVNEWIRDGVIQPSLSDYASPIVLAKKRDGSIRLCVDYRHLNRKIIRDRYPLPIIEDQLDALQGVKLYSTLDLKNGFFHVTVDEQSRKYTAFITPDGHYEFLRVPFGLCNSPAVFQRFINIVFRDLIQTKIVLTYLDDLIIPSIDYESGVRNLEKVLQVASEAGLVINWQKCKFLRKRVEFLGHILESGYVSPSERKIEAVKNFPEPTNIKQLQSFLGLSGYFRKFVPQYSLIARPLSDLLKANIKFEFKEKERHAFLHLKEILCTKPVLKLYKVNAETELHTDASMHGFGAILLQRDEIDNAWHPIYYSSHKTTSAEQKYPSYELEVLAVIKALRKFRTYLLGSRSRS